MTNDGAKNITLADIQRLTLQQSRSDNDKW